MDLIMDIWKANYELERLRARNACLENILRAVSRQCRWRETGLCDLNCPGRLLCDCEGLEVFEERRAQYGG